MQHAGLVRPVISYTVQVDVPGHGFVDVLEQECQDDDGACASACVRVGPPKSILASGSACRETR